MGAYSHWLSLSFFHCVFSYVSSNINHIEKIFPGNCLESHSWMKQMSNVPKIVFYKMWRNFHKSVAVEGNKAITGIGTDQSLMSPKSGAVCKFEEKALRNSFVEVFCLRLWETMCSLPRVMLGALLDWSFTAVQGNRQKLSRMFCVGVRSKSNVLDNNVFILPKSIIVRDLAAKL